MIDFVFRGISLISNTFLLDGWSLCYKIMMEIILFFLYMLVSKCVRICVVLCCIVLLVGVTSDLDMSFEFEVICTSSVVVVHSVTSVVRIMIFVEVWSVGCCTCRVVSLDRIFFKLWSVLFTKMLMSWLPNYTPSLNLEFIIYYTSLFS